MPNTYKVWIEVEEYDEERDDYEKLDSSFGATAVFDNEKTAQSFATNLNQLGERLASGELSKNSTDNKLKRSDTKKLVNETPFPAKAKCDNCGKEFDDLEELNSYHDFWSRVEIGKEIPAGDCPDCGGFAYLVKPKHSLKVCFGQSEEAREQTVTEKGFNSKAELDAYIEGLEDCDGWLEYEILEDD